MVAFWLFVIAIILAFGDGPNFSLLVRELQLLREEIQAFRQQHKAAEAAKGEDDE